MVGILLRLLGPILTNYSILGQFLDFHHFAIFLQSDVIMQQWLHLHATSSSMSFHVIIIAISSFIPCHHYLCLSFDFHWVHSAIMSLVIPLSWLSSLFHLVLGYSYFIYLVSISMLQRSSLSSLLCWSLSSIMLFFFLKVKLAYSLLLVFNAASFIHFITQLSLLYLFFT